MADDEFEPNDCEAIIDGDRVRLRFSRDNGTSREVILPRAWIPSLVSLLTSQIAPGSAVPIDLQSLRPDQTFQVQGFRVRRNTDGRRLLLVSVGLLDQGRDVKIPFELSPGDARQLVEWLK